MTLCSYDSATDTFAKVYTDTTDFPISYTCTELATFTTCDTSENIRCEGDPYSSAYFTVYGAVAAQRHSALFVLYAFDSLHTTSLKTPTLNLTNCVFSEFLNQT